MPEHRRTGLNQRPRSPCKQVCQLNPAGELCTGCGRTIGEIAEWPGATSKRQHEIVRLAAARITA